MHGAGANQRIILVPVRAASSVYGKPNVSVYSHVFITSAKEGMFYPPFVFCLSA